jgi:CBS domain-containing protein
MFVREVMTRPAATVGVEETLDAAALKMRELGVGALPVVDRGALAGMVTDRDLAVRATATGADPTATLVGDVMTPQLFTCGEDDDLDEAARIMEERAVRRLLVLDREGHLVGMLSVDDLASASVTLAADVLRHGRDPALPFS